MPVVPSRPRRLAIAAVIACVGIGTPVLAQSAPSASAKAQTSVASLLGGWTGTVTVQIGDSTINAPVVYTFVEQGGAVVGTAMVPGQGMGPISNVARSGANVKFRVTAKRVEQGKEVPKLLEHDATVGSDGVMAGVVTLDGKLMAKFRIAPRK